MRRIKAYWIVVFGDKVGLKHGDNVGYTRVVDVCLVRLRNQI